MAARWPARQEVAASRAKLSRGRIRTPIPRAKLHDSVSCFKPLREVAERRRRMRPTQGQSTQVSAVVWIANATFSSLFSNQVLSIQTRPNGCEVVLDERRDHRPQRATNNFTQQI